MSLVVPVVVLLSGCAVFSAPEVPEFVQLHIDGREAVVVAAEHIPQSLLVSAPRAAPGYATPRFAYLLRDRQLSYYGRHEWIAEPARMVHTAVLRVLDTSGRFDAVITPQSGANGDLRLDIELLALHQDFRSGSGSELVLTLRVQLIALSDRSVVATRTIDIREPAGANAVTGAAAADRALARALEALVAFCVDES